MYAQHLAETRLYTSLRTAVGLQALLRRFSLGCARHLADTLDCIAIDSEPSWQQAGPTVTDVTCAPHPAALCAADDNAAAD